MSVYECPECGGRLSTEALACPHCGYQKVSEAVEPSAEAVLWSGKPGAAALHATLLRAVASLLLVAVLLLGVPFWASQQEVVVSFFEELGVRPLDVPAVIFVLTVIVWMWLTLGEVLQIRVRRYTLTSRQLTVREGILSRRERHVDLRTVDEARVVQGFYQRLFSIGTIIIKFSSGGSAGYRLVGVRQPEKVSEMIRATVLECTKDSLYVRQIR